MIKISKKEFEALVLEALKSFPEKFRQRLENIEIVIENSPKSSQFKKRGLQEDILILGLYQGIPKTKRWYYQGVLPDKITLFKENIEKMAKTKEDLKEIIKKTIWHEIGHYFGLDEKRLREIEIKKWR